MQSSKLSESEELQRRTIAAQIKLEEKKLQLEIQIRKKNEEEKQKELLKKQQKEALLNQRKEAKKVNPLKPDISRLSQDSEVKDSLSQEKADEIQNNLHSILRSKPTDTLSADTEPHPISGKNIQKPEKQNSDRNDFEDVIQNRYYSKIDHDEEEDEEDDSTHKTVNIVAPKGQVTSERLLAHKIPEDLPVQKTELNVISHGSQKYNARRDEFVGGNEQKSNLKNIEVLKNNLPADQIKMEGNPIALKGDRDNLGGAVKMQLELANQMKKFKLDEEKKKKNKEEAGLQRKHEILRQIKGANTGQLNPVKPDNINLNSFSTAEKNRNLWNSKNFSPEEEEVVSRQNKPAESRNEQNSPEASQEEIQYEESSHSEDLIEKEQEDFEQSHATELQNDNEQYDRITQSFHSQRNDTNLKASQQRLSGNYKDGFKNDSVLSYENKDTQDHQPQSYAQLHARKNQKPEMKSFEARTNEGLSKLLESYEKGKPEEDQGHYQMSQEDNKRNDDIELNYSQSEREFEDTNQNPLLTFGRKDFIKKDEGMNPLDMSNSLRESFHETKPSKAQDKPIVDQGNWGYSKSTVEIQKPGDNSYEPLQEQEGDEEDYEYDNDAPQAEEDEEQNNNTGEFGNNVDGEQWQNPSDEDYPDQSRLTGEKFYYFGDQQHLGSFSGSGSKKKELRRYGDDQEDDFTSENLDYKSQDKPTRVRKGWGEAKNDSNSAKDPTSMNSFTPIGSEGNEEEAATERQDTEEVKHEDDRKIENKLITFDDSEDEAARQRKMKKFENFMQRRQESQERIKEKKEKDKVKKAQNQRQKEEITFGNVSDDGTPKKSKSPINRDKYAKNIKHEQEKMPAPTGKGMRPPSANIRNQEKPPRKDLQEELKSVEASAKSNKSEMKSPSAPNNIFAPQRPSITGKKEFSKPSNKQNIKNAITNVCLAGEPNRKEREEVLAKLEEVKSEVNFILVFNAISARLAFKAVYAYDSLSGEVKKVYSNGTVPDTIESKMVQNYYNYNNGPKEFKPIQGNKNFSLRVDAVSLQPQLFRKPTSQNIF